MEKYTYRAWKGIAKILTSDKEVREYFTLLPVTGKTIKNIRIIGKDYLRNEYRLGVWWITYCQENNIPLKISDDEIPDVNFSLIPDDLQDFRTVETDEPFILEFTDGQQIELEANDVFNHVIAACNEIPPNAKADVNTNNIDGNIIFSSCLGKTITAVKFLPETPQEYCVPAVLFILDDRTWIKIEGNLDYCKISHQITDSKGNEQTVPVSWGELKKDCIICNQCSPIAY